MASAIQRAALPTALHGRNLLAVGPTGTGKTLVTAITAAHRLSGAPSLPGRPRAVLLAPTRELVDQHVEVVSEVFAGAGLRAARPAPAGSGVRPLPAGPVDLVVGTPGRLAALLRSGELDPTRIGFVALDEADHLLSESFVAQTRLVLQRCPDDAVLLATTATADPATVAELRRHRQDIQVITAGGGEPELDGPERPGEARAEPAAARSGLELVVAAEPTDLVVRLAPRLRRALVFVPRRDQTAELAHRLDRAGVTTADIHGAASPSRRAEALAALGAGRVRVLVTTDLTGRGLDLPRVREIVHVGLPHSVEDLVHRSGRTGRGTEPAGVVMWIVRPHEAGRARQMATAAGMALHESRAEAADLDRLLGPAPRTGPTRPGAARSPARGRRPAPSRRHRPKRTKGGR